MYHFEIRENVYVILSENQLQFNVVDGDMYRKLEIENLISKDITLKRVVIVLNEIYIRDLIFNFLSLARVNSRVQISSIIFVTTLSDSNVARMFVKAPLCCSEKMRNSVKNKLSSYAIACDEISNDKVQREFLL
jgi:hypothetical protein